MTYEITILLLSKKALKTKWVFKEKDVYGNKKFKARLVIKSYSQKEDVDYCEMFSLVINYASLRYLFSLAVKENLMVNHMDMTTAYLQGNVDEEIYFEPPSLFEEKNNKEEKKKYGA